MLEQLHLLHIGCQPTVQHLTPPFPVVLMTIQVAKITTWSPSSQSLVIYLEISVSNLFLVTWKKIQGIQCTKTFQTETGWMSWKSHARIMSKSDLCWGNQWMFLGTWEWLKTGSSNGRDGSGNKGTFRPARPTMKLIASPWKSMVGEWKSAFFRGELAVRFREFFNDLFSGSISLLSLFLWRYPWDWWLLECRVICEHFCDAWFHATWKNQFIFIWSARSTGDRVICG